MREWYGGDRRIERTLLVLLIRASNRTEIVLGSRARKKIANAIGDHETHFLCP